MNVTGNSLIEWLKFVASVGSLVAFVGYGIYRLTR